MSGLTFRYLLLLAAAAMSGVTAFTVTPVATTPDSTLKVSESPANRARLSDPPSAQPSFVARVSGLPNSVIVDRAVLASPTQVERPAKTSATLMFGGDILIHNGVRERAALGGGTFDFTPMFSDIRPLVSSADLAICHLEVPLTSTNENLSSYPKFNAPHELADAIASAGFDGCSTASNHSMDQKASGLIDTLDVLDGAGLGHAGTARTPGEAGSATFYRLDGLSVAHIAGTFWLNGLTTPEDKDWMAQRLDVDRMLEMASRARSDGADIVVVSVHCCAEYEVAPTADQVNIFNRLSESSSVDLVVGHHSHVVGPVGMVDDKYVVYGLGNLLSGQFHRPGTSEAFVAVANAQWADGKWSIVSVAAVPTVIENGSYRILPAKPDGKSYARTMATLRSGEVAVSAFPAPTSTE